jgi:hypothetical protein
MAHSLPSAKESLSTHPCLSDLSSGEYFTLEGGYVLMFQGWRERHGESVREDQPQLKSAHAFDRELVLLGWTYIKGATNHGPW